MAADARKVGSGASSSNTVTTASGTSTVSGSTFLIFVAWDNGVNVSTISDSKSNTYTALGTEQLDGVGGRSRVYRCINGTGGTSHTATATFSGTAFPTLHLIECTGVDTTSPIDVVAQTQTSGGSSGSSSTINTGTLSTANQVVVGLAALNNRSNGTYASSTLTMISQEDDIVSYWTSGVAKTVVTATTSVACTFTAGNSNGQGGLWAVTLKEASGSGNLSISSGLGALTVTGLAPTLRIPERITAGLGELTITGLAPTASVGSTAVQITTGLGALTITGHVPTQTLTLPSPAAASLVLTGHAPTMALGIAPALGQLTLTGLAPTISATDNQFVAAGVGLLTITGLVPSVAVSAPGAITTGLGQLALTGLAPSIFVNDSASITTGLASLTFTGFAPSFQVTANTTVNAGLGALVITGQVPTVAATANQFAALDVGQLSITGHAPALSQAGSFTALPGVAALELIGFAPSVSNSGDVVLSRGGLGGPVRRNYIIKGKRYLQVTNEELAYLLARDMVDVARDDIKVVYKKSKPHKVSVNAWKELQDAFKLFDKPATDLFDDDEEAAMLLL